MGLILDSSVLIAAEKRQFDLSRFFSDHPEELFFIAAITASELLHGVELAKPAARRTERSRFVEGVIGDLPVIEFDVAIAREHARIWAQLEAAGIKISPYDLLIAATAISYGHALVTLNAGEFRRVAGPVLVDTSRHLTA